MPLFAAPVPVAARQGEGRFAGAGSGGYRIQTAVLHAFMNVIQPLPPGTGRRRRGAPDAGTGTRSVRERGSAAGRFRQRPPERGPFPALRGIASVDVQRCTDGAHALVRPPIDVLDRLAARRLRIPPLPPATVEQPGAGIARTVGAGTHRALHDRGEPGPHPPRLRVRQRRRPAAGVDPDLCRAPRPRSGCPRRPRRRPRGASCRSCPSGITARRSGPCGPNNQPNLRRR